MLLRRRVAMALLVSFLSVAAYADSITYLDGNGVQQTANAIQLTSTMLANLSKTNPLGAGWYYVSDTLTVNNNIPIKSEEVNSVPTDVHIILTNRALLNVNGVIYKHWDYANGALWVHSQTTDTLQMGTLTVNNNSGVILGDTINNDGYIYFQKQVDGCIQADSVMVCGGNIGVFGPNKSSDNYGMKSTVSDVFIHNAKFTAADIECAIRSSRNLSVNNSKIAIDECLAGIYANGSVDINESITNIDAQSLAMLLDALTDSISITDSEVAIHSEIGILSYNTVKIRNCTMNFSITSDGPFAINANGGEATIENSIISANNEGQCCLMCRGGYIKDSEVEFYGGFFGIQNTYGDISIINTNGTFNGNVYGIYSSGKVVITNGYTDIYGNVNGVYAGDSIILDWTNDRETRIYAKDYLSQNGQLVFKNCFGLLSNSAIATAENADNEELRAAYPLRITSANAATYYERHYDMQVPRALVASIVEINIENNDTTLNFVPVAGGTYPLHSEILPANTPVMITRNPDLAGDTISTYAMIYYSYYEQPYNSYPENILKGSDVDTLTYGGDKYFRLSASNGVIGWYPSINSLPFDIPAHQAWMPLTNEQVATIKGYSYFVTTDLYAKSSSVFITVDGEEETTGIDKTEESTESKADIWYDLNGRELQSKPTRKDIYIYKGVKIVVD